MTPSPDIINDFSRLQQTCNELGKSNVAFAEENARLKDWIREQGQQSDTCTYYILGKEICQYCQCGRAKDILSNIGIDNSDTTEGENRK